MKTTTGPRFYNPLTGNLTPLDVLHCIEMGACWYSFCSDATLEGVQSTDLYLSATSSEFCLLGNKNNIKFYQFI